MHPTFRSAVGGVWLWAVLTLGVLVRLMEFTKRGSLWGDEATLALNIASRSFGELTAPLNYDQYAPVLFLWSQRVALLVGGVNDGVLRALPLLTGIILLIVLAALARRVWDTETSLIALTISAFCPALIFYSTEAKPYGLDALTSTVLVYLGVKVGARSESHRLSLLGLAGVLGIWLSSPAVFTLAGIGLALLLRSRNSLRDIRHVSGLLALWGANFLAAYLLFYSRAYRSGYMNQFWGDTYLDFHASDSFIQSAALIMGTLHGVFAGTGSIVEGLTGPRAIVLIVWLLTSSLTLIGAFHLGRRHGAWAVALLAGPIAAMAAASLLGLYPIVVRLSVFVAPLWIILMAGGISATVPLFPASLRSAGTVTLAVALPSIGVPRDGTWLYRAEQGNDAARVIRELTRANVNHAPVYVNALGVPTWLFYTTDWSQPDSVRFRTLVQWNERGGPAFENAPTRGRTVAVGEGGHLVLHRRGTEVIGLPTGMQMRSRRALSQTSPDTGWARNEAWRLRSTGRSEAWLAFFHNADRSDVYLTRELESAGGRLVSAVVGRNALAYRYDLHGIAALDANR